MGARLSYPQALFDLRPNDVDGMVRLLQNAARAPASDDETPLLAAEPAQHAETTFLASTPSALPSGEMRRRPAVGRMFMVGAAPAILE